MSLGTDLVTVTKDSRGLELAEHWFYADWMGRNALRLMYNRFSLLMKRMACGNYSSLPS